MMHGWENLRKNERVICCWGQSESWGTSELVERFKRWVVGGGRWLWREAMLDKCSQCRRKFSQSLINSKSDRMCKCIWNNEQEKFWEKETVSRYRGDPEREGRMKSLHAQTLPFGAEIVCRWRFKNLCFRETRVNGLRKRIRWSVRSR